MPATLATKEPSPQALQPPVPPTQDRGSFFSRILTAVGLRGYEPPQNLAESLADTRALIGKLFSPFAYVAKWGVAKN